MSTPNPSYDHQWKALPPSVLLALIHLALPQVTAPLIPWQSELTVTTARRADDVFQTEIEGEAILLHLEYQNYPDHTMPRRMYDYDSDIERVALAHDPRPPTVISLVIWATRQPTPPPVYHMTRYGKVLAHHEYFEVHLSAIAWQQPLDPVLLVLAPLFGDIHREDLLSVGERLFQNAPPAQRDTLLGAFLAMAQRRFGSIDDVIQAILVKVGTAMRDMIQAIAESPIGQTLIDQGKVEGIVEGKIEGRIEGKVEGVRDAIDALWRHAYGAPLPPDVAAALSAMPEARALDVVVAFGERPSEADLRARFGW